MSPRICVREQRYKNDIAALLCESEVFKETRDSIVGSGTS